MTVIYGFLIMVEVIASALLIGVIFLQKTKGGMGGSAFGAGMGEAIFGSRMGNVLTKATVVLGVIFLANTVLLTMLTSRREHSGSVMDGVAPVAPMSVPSGPMGSMPVPMDLPESTPVSDDAVAPEAIAIPAPAAVEVPVAEVSTEVPAPAAE